MCLRNIVPPHQPAFSFPGAVNSFLDDVVYTQQYYADGNHWNIRHTLDTPVRTIESIAGRNLAIDVSSDSPQTHFVKEPQDWRVINYAFRRMLQEIRPNYDKMARDQDALGDTGYTIAFVDKTPFQRAWIELASLERTVIDCVDQPDELLEYLAIQRAYHKRVAEIAAGCPSDLVLINDNIPIRFLPAITRNIAALPTSCTLMPFEGRTRSWLCTMTACWHI